MQEVRRLIKLGIKALFGERMSDLWRSPEEEIEVFKKQILAGMSRVPDRLASKEELFLHFNEEGKKPPIFWCFNNWAEAIFLAYHLGSDRPLYAMHSLYRIAESDAKKAMHKVKLAKTYGDLICELYPKGSVVIGGNCQSSPIAESIAHYLLEKRGDAPMLISLEHQPFYAYPGRLVMLFGDRSEDFNPFLNGESPVAGWKNKHQNLNWGIVKGAHGEYFREPGVQELSCYIEEVTDRFFNGTVCSSGEITPSNRSSSL